MKTNVVKTLIEARLEDLLQGKITRWRFIHSVIEILDRFPDEPVIHY